VQAQMLEGNTQRAGATYMRGAIGSAGPEQCWALCARDNRCKAWTWERPGVSSSQSMCSLKAAVTPGHFSPCCVSGVSAKLEQQIELGLDGRPARRQTAALAPRRAVRSSRPIAPAAYTRPAPVPVQQAITAPQFTGPPVQVRQAPVRPVQAVPRRSGNGVPIYSVNREIQAAPPAYAQAPAPAQATASSVQAPVSPAKPSTTAKRQAPKGSFHLLGE